MAITQGEVSGKLFGAFKGSTSVNTSIKLATFVVQQVYDTENQKGENRAILINMIDQALKHYKGDI